MTQSGFLMRNKETCFNCGTFDGSFDFITCLDETNPQLTLVQVSPCQVSSLTEDV